MGWKNVKEAYRIGHTVQMRGDRLVIGSAYCPELIVVNPATGVPAWGKLGASGNNDLARYFAEIVADPAKFRELFAAPDVFSADLDAWTFDQDAGTVHAEKCEVLGWPNCTHAGRQMYENSHFATPGEAAAYGLSCARACARWAAEALTKKRLEVVEEEARLMAAQAAVEAFQANFPELAPQLPNEKSDA